jgi:hypothetical protein
VVRAAQRAADAARARGASPTELSGLGLAACDETRQIIAKSKRSD